MSHQYNTKESVDSGINVFENIYQGTTSGKFNTSLRLLRHWRGSVFRLVWDTFLVWLICYGLLSLIYHKVLFEEPKSKGMQMFELICVYANRFGNKIDIKFLVGFYVTQVVGRWWAQFMALPIPDFVAIKLVNIIPGTVCIFLIFNI